MNSELGIVNFDRMREPGIRGKIFARRSDSDGLQPKVAEPSRLSFCGGTPQPPFLQLQEV
jgi:hypothetical protein